MHPRGARDRARDAQERPRGAQEAPKSAQEMPKRRPRGTGRSPTPSKNEFRKIQNASRTHLGAFGEHVADPSSKKRFPKPLQTTFAWFFSMMAKSANLDFYRSCRCFRRFFKNACCSIDVGATREKLEKIYDGSLQNPPWTLPGFSKIEPGAFRNTKNSTGMGRHA